MEEVGWRVVRQKVDGISDPLVSERRFGLTDVEGMRSQERNTRSLRLVCGPSRPVKG